MSHLNGPDQVLPSTHLTSCQPDGAVALKVSKDEGTTAALPPISVPSMLMNIAEEFPDHPALMSKVDGQWVATTYADYHNQVRVVARAFIALGLERFHGVCILGFNSKEWFLADLGAIFAGGLAAGVYTTNSPEACGHCAINCQAQIYVVEDQKQLDKILKIRDTLPFLKAIVQYKGQPTVDGVLSWEELLEIGQKQPEDLLQKRLKQMAVNQCCTLIYTSGTTGPPKGVMLSHDNITWTTLAVSTEYKFTRGYEQMISYLPLSHVAAQLIDIYSPLSTGGTVWFADADALKGSLINTLKEVRPTGFLGVPRVWEKIYEKMTDLGRKTKGAKKSIATWAKAVGTEKNLRRESGDLITKPAGFHVANAVVFRNIKKALGLDRCKICISGAAPITTEIVRYFHSLNITLVEVYGMSESSGPQTLGTPTAFKMGSVGRTFSGADTMIADQDMEGNGEICMRGRNVCMGYLLQPDKTSEAIDEEGWLHSGDIGKFVNEYLYITGRLKEIIITAGGENIPPVLIEDAIKAQLPCISNAMLIGDKKKYLSILLTLKTDIDLQSGDALNTLTPACLEWCQSVGSSSKTVYEVLAGPDARVMSAIQDGIDAANKAATSNAQKIQKWTIVPSDFTIPSGELGPTMKLKRPVVVKQNSETIDRIYA